VPWENDPTKWVSANDYGADIGDDDDDSAAIQAAIDFAAAQGKSVVTLRGLQGGDPNWYWLKSDVVVKAPVRRIMGLGFGRIIGNGRMIVNDQSAPLVKFENLGSFGGPPPTLENASRSRTMVVESCDLVVAGSGLGDIFVTNAAARVILKNRRQKLWARQLNPEGESDTGLSKNLGGDLWVLGVKHEGKGVKWLTTAGGRTELHGIFNYGSGADADDPRPVFDVKSGVMSFTGYWEISFGSTSPVVVRNSNRTEPVIVKNGDLGGGWLQVPLYSDMPVGHNRRR
jgi:hypothetical protein